MNAGDGVGIIAGPRIMGDTVLDTTDLSVLTSLALLAEINSPDSGSARSITWNADVVIKDVDQPHAGGELGRHGDQGRST